MTSDIHTRFVLHDDGGADAMPIEWELDPDTGMLIVTATGKVPAGAYLEIWDQIIEDPRIASGPRILADFRSVEVTQTGADVRGVAAGAKAFDDFMRGGRMAVLATQQASFGLARMYATLIDSLAIEVRVFRDYDEARAWALEPSAETGSE